MSKLKILLLYIRPVLANARTIVDHALSVQRYSRHDVYSVSLMHTFGSLPALLDLAQFDVIVIHYSIVASLDAYLNPDAREAIARFDGLKVQFIQDEYRFVNDTINASRRLGIDVLFTCVPDAEIEKVYSSTALPHVRKVSILTGYVPEDLTRVPVPSIAARPIDVGYRARKPAYWLGTLGLDKWRVAESFLQATRDSALVCDISCDERSRLYGRKWTRFLTSCKAVLGVESGASVFDFTGEIQRNVESFLGVNPGAGFEEVRARFFAAEEGKIRLNQISPRCFEAAALRTAMVLFEGEYSGILAPWRHYIPLRKDFGNIGAVVEHLRDINLLQEYVDRTYHEVARNPAYSYAGFVRSFDDIVEREFEARIGARRRNPRESARPLHGRVVIPLYAFLFYVAQVPGYLLRRLLHLLWLRLPEPLRVRLRPIARLRKRLSPRPSVRN